MRLRYLSLRDAPPLKQLEIPFAQAPVLGRQCAIHFVVGINGSGKSRLLQALAQLFLALEQAENPPFYVTLAYDLYNDDETTIYLQYQPGQTTFRLVELPKLDDTVEWDWGNLLDDSAIEQVITREYEGASGTISSFLPSALIVYTSGVTNWGAIFTPPQPLLELPAFETIEEERPLNWSVAQEQTFLRKQGDDDQAIALKSADTDSLQWENRTTRLGYFIAPAQLRLAAAAVTLHQAMSDFARDSFQARQHPDEMLERKHSRSGIRHLLDEIGWEYPVTFGLQINFAPDSWDKRDTSRILDLYKIASTVISEPEPSNERLLLFDLQETITHKDGQSQRRIEALLDIFREAEQPLVTPYDLFTQLYRWQKVGIINDIVLSIKKRGVDDLMLYDWLSDGEQLFIGRMALFQLLKPVGGSDDSQRKINNVLVLLDEPETHFNDQWKRRIVDIIDDNLRDTHNEIVISTHSSIALTDVFHVEVTQLQFAETAQRTVRRRSITRTFGASPNVIMREIFDAPESVGQRAAEFLDLILMLAAHPDDVHAIWSAEPTDEVAANRLPQFSNLLNYFAELPHDYGEGEALQSFLFKTLQTIRNFTRQSSTKTEITVVDSLIALEDLIGEGYYQFEFRHRLRALRKLGHE